MPVYSTRKKYVMAIQWKGNNLDEIIKFYQDSFPAKFSSRNMISGLREAVKCPLFIKINDFIVKSGDHMEFISESVFNNTYEIVED